MIFLKRQVMTQIHRAGQAAVIRAEEVHDPHLLFQIRHLVKARIPILQALLIMMKIL